MRPVVTSFLTASALALPSASSAQAANPPQNPKSTTTVALPSEAQDEAAVRAVLKEKYTKQNACDLSYWGAYITEDATEYLPNYRRPQRKDLLSALPKAEAFCKAGGEHDLRIEVQGFDRIANNVALIYGVGRYKLTPPGGGGFDAEFNWTDVMLRTADGWRVRHTHVGPILPDEVLKQMGVDAPSR